MQVRIPTIRDQKQINSVIESNLPGFAPVKNLEQEYFYNDGIFVVAEDNEQISSILAACANNEILEVKLLYVDNASHYSDQIELQFAQILSSFAKRMFYKNISLGSVHNKHFDELLKKIE